MSKRFSLDTGPSPTPSIQPRKQRAQTFVVEVERDGAVAEEQGAGFVAELAARAEEGGAVVAGSEGSRGTGSGVSLGLFGGGWVGRSGCGFRSVGRGRGRFVCWAEDF